VLYSEKLINFKRLSRGRRDLQTEKSAENMILNSLDNIIRRSSSSGGFTQRDGGIFRTDATAWAIIAISRMKENQLMIESACRRMAGNQLPDGRVVLMEGFDSAWWPTPLATLAWKKANGFENEASAAVNFLLYASGRHFPKEKDSPAGHDTSIRGWSWIENTHSWIEPTAISILALKANGNGRHDRVLEAVRMILDRQLPSGGWNYGNTTVFHRELLPMPEHTGQALCALSGYVQAPEVQKSINYAKDQLQVLHTPLSLCWCLFGLSAWSVNVPDARARVLKCLSLQEKFGAYDTTLLALLVIAYFANGDLLAFLDS
jgi:hypothetical protein